MLITVVLNLFLRMAGEDPGGIANTWSAFGPLFVQFLPQMMILMLQLPLFFLFNFLIFFGPLLFFGIKQMKGYEPGDADWGVKLTDVRGQAEPKEEVTRVISLWQSGEEFEKSGGKRERGLLFLGAPGTGKTMLSKAIATSFNSPFVLMPGSGFAQTFIGMDVVVVMFLISKARRLARKWGGQCIVFIDEIDAVGMRRQALQGGAGGGGFAKPVEGPGSFHDHSFYGPMGALTSTGDLILETRAWRERLFAARAPEVGSIYPPALAAPGPDGPGLHVPRHGRDGRRDGAQPAAGADGRRRRPAVHAQVLHQPHQHVPRRDLHRPAAHRQALAAHAPAQAPLRAGLLHRRDQRPDRRPRPGAHPPGAHGPAHLVPHATKDDRKDIFELYMAKVDHDPELDTDRRRDELARITNGYSPAMIEQVCSMALTYAHSEGRTAVRRGRTSWRR